MLGPTIPILNPIRVAEEFAMIDAMSGGRLVAQQVLGVDVLGGALDVALLDVARPAAPRGESPEQIVARVDRMMVRD